VGPPASHSTTEAAYPLASSVLSRQTIWASTSLAVSIRVQRQEDAALNQSIEPLCWKPTTADHSGDALGLWSKRILNGSDDISWMLLLAQPNSSSESSWVPTSEGPYVDVVLTLSVHFECSVSDTLVVSDSGGRNASSLVTIQTIDISIPVAGLPQELASEVQVAARSLQLAAAVVAGGGGAAVGRVMAMRAAVLCTYREEAAKSTIGPLGLKIESAADCDDDDSSIAMYRGTIVGNIVIAAVLLCLIVVAAFAMARMQCQQLGQILRHLAFPSSLLPVWLVVLSSTTTATLQLALSSSGCASDLVCVIVGIALIAVPLAALVALAAHWSSPMTPRRLKEDPTTGFFGRLFRRSWTWELMDQDGAHNIADNNPLRHANMVLREYRVLWFATLDALVLIVVGVLVAISGHGPPAQCITAGILIAVCFAIQLLLCVVFLPFTTLFWIGYGVFTATVTLISACLQLSMFSVRGSDSDTAALLERLSLAAAICDIVVVVAAFLRILVDMYGLATQLPSLLIALRAEGARRPSQSKNAKHRSVAGEGPAGEGDIVLLDVMPLHDDHSSLSSSNDDVNNFLDAIASAPPAPLPAPAAPKGKPAPVHAPAPAPAPAAPKGNTVAGGVDDFDDPFADIDDPEDPFDI
jgi:hypothetical protein